MNVSRELLAAYLDDALSDVETAQVEQALRQSESLRKQVVALQQELDRGDHSVGAVWRRQRLTCPTREQLGNYLLGVLDTGFADYLAFHLKTVACPFCQANLTDLKALQTEAPPQRQKRRQRFYDSSAPLLRKGKG